MKSQFIKKSVKEKRVTSMRQGVRVVQSFKTARYVKLVHAAWCQQI